MIQQGKKVFVEYTVCLTDGTQVDSNVGEEPLAFIIGSHQVFPALEAALIGLSPGDQKQVQLKPEEAYGPVVKEAFREVNVEVVPAPLRYAGAVLAVQDPEGELFPIRVHQIQDDKAVLDFNHPLAGKALQFDLKVIEVQ